MNLNMNWLCWTTDAAGGYFTSKILMLLISQLSRSAAAQTHRDLRQLPHRPLHLLVLRFQLGHLRGDPVVVVEGKNESKDSNI